MRVVALLLSFALAGCLYPVGRPAPSRTRPPVASPTGPGPGPAPDTSVGANIPINDLETGTYQGEQGGLYPGGSNALPAAHLTEGQTRASQIAGLAKIGVASIGLSNTNQEWCDGVGSVRSPCKSWTFMAKAKADALVNNAKIIFANGAHGGAISSAWASPSHAVWTTFASRLSEVGLAPGDLRVVWLKVTQAGGLGPFPAGAQEVEGELGQILRNVRMKYPSVLLVVLSSRSYGGYGTLSPEPGAYEHGFSVKWVIAAQIAQVGGGVIDPQSGDLGFSVAPWAGWASYHWANDGIPRSDGLVWLFSDFVADGTHMSPAGAGKVSDLLLAFFKTSPVTCPWFLAAGC